VNRLPLGVVVLLLVCGCTRQDTARADAELDALRAEVRALGDSAALRFHADTLLASAPGMRADTLLATTDVDSGGRIAVGLRVNMLQEILSSAASHYLDDVRLHLRLNAVVRAGDQVRVRIGPVNAVAGRWTLVVTVQRVDAMLRAGAIDVVVGDSNRLDLTVPVHVSDATGGALIDFKWDAARLASVVCNDFAISEPFAGYVRPRVYRMRGYFVIAAEDGYMIARPVLRDRISVSPQPTEESWERVRQILSEQDRIFKCGLALSPDRMEAMLRELLTEGFRFRLPASILRPIRLPASLLNDIEVAGRRAAVTIMLDPPRLTHDRLWLHAGIRTSAADDTPIRIEGG
jgi:hypothetical protein